VESDSPVRDGRSAAAADRISSTRDADQKHSLLPRHQLLLLHRRHATKY